MADKAKPARKRSTPQPEPTPPVTHDPTPLLWMDGVIGFVMRFERYAWDVLGVVLLSFGLTLALGLFDLTRGTFLTPIASLIRYGLGYGSAFVVLAAFAGSLAAFRRQRAAAPLFSLNRVLAFEGAAFSALALLTVIGGGSLDRAAAGLDGGIVGWGLAEIPLIVGFGRLGQVVILSLLFLVFCVYASGATTWLSQWAEAVPATELASEDGLVSFAQIPVSIRETETEAPPLVSEVAKNGKKKQPPVLPPEFRKSFHVPAQQANPDEPPPPRSDRLPPLNMLVGEHSVRPDERHINLTAGLIEKTLAEFGVPSRVVGFRIGPTVTQYALEPGFIEKPGPDGTVLHQKVRVSQISALSRDLSLALSAERLRIEAPVPGHAYVGIEVPNQHSSVVRLRSILESDAFYKSSSPLNIALGRDVSGHPVVADLARMPHMLIAGTTGSGKSVCIAALTACLVMNNTPSDLRLVMVDTKMVELVRFNGLPHLYGKVETELERILGVLRWAVQEMDHRYRLLEAVHARDLESYNRKMEKRKQEPLPRIVLIIDELADLMMSAPDQTEPSLVRLAQLARATGIHLVVATQRPSTDVITGLIKANFPARIAFTVASSVDSRVILDTTGAETLLGRGDMLFLNPEAGAPSRAQGVLIADQEVERIITHWQKMCPQGEEKPAPWEEILSQDENSPDSLVQQAITVVRSTQKASASLLQRRLRIGYPRAARLIDELEELGIVGPSQGGGREREVLVEREDSDELDDEEPLA